MVTSKALASKTAESTIAEVYGENAAVIGRHDSKGNELSILRADSGNIYVVSSGTALKWETALRKALETIASTPTLTVKDKAPSICLKLSAPDMTEADKELIKNALGAVGVKAVFCAA